MSDETKLVFAGTCDCKWHGTAHPYCYSACACDSGTQERAEDPVAASGVSNDLSVLGDVQ